MTHLELPVGLRPPVHAAGQDILDAADRCIARAVDATTAIALARLVNLGESAAFALNDAYRLQQETLRRAGVIPGDPAA